MIVFNIQYRVCVVQHDFHGNSFVYSNMKVSGDYFSNINVINQDGEQSSNQIKGS